MLSAVVLILLLAAYILWLCERYLHVWRHIAKFPGPPAIPILGNALQLGFKAEQYLTSVRGWVKEYDFETFRIYGGPQPYIVTLNPKTIEHVLSSTSLIYKDDVYDYLRPWLGNGLLTSNGQKWMKHRKMLTPSFHFQILQDFLHVINDTADRFMNLLGSLAEEGQMIDFQHIVTRNTIDVICETAMGTRVNAIEGQPSPMVQAMNDICYAIQERMFRIVKRPFVVYFFTAEYRLQRSALKVLRSAISKIIEERRQTLKRLSESAKENGGTYRKPKMAFLDNLLTAEVDGQQLTSEEIFEEVSTFMFEGHDTTASALTFATFCLSRHPEVQQLAFEEQRQLYGDDTRRSPTYQELKDMKYLELVIRETLRIFPSVPIIARTMERSTEIDGHMIPKGTTIVVPIIGLGMNERSFPQPFAFRPERYQPSKRIDASPFDTVPFSAGPRNCIGQKFAMMELKVVLSKILRNFQILPAVDGLPAGIHDPNDPNDKAENPYDPVLVAMLTLKSSNGVYVRLRRRVY